MKREDDVYKDAFEVDEIIDKVLTEESKKDCRYVTFKVSYKDIDEKLVSFLGGKTKPSYLYFKMRTMIVRKGWKDHKDFPLKRDYYDNGYLVMSMSYRKMAEEFGISVDSVKKGILTLIDKGWIKVVRHKIKGNYYGQYIYIFGRVMTEEDGTKHERFYNDPFEGF